MRFNLQYLALGILPLYSTQAFSFGLELEAGGHIGKESYEAQSTTTTNEDSSEQSDELESLSNPLTYGLRFDARALFLHNSKVNLSAGSGFVWERSSADASADGTTIEQSSYRIVIEPKARLTLFASRNFALTAGLGYFIGLTGSATASLQNQDFSQKDTFDQDESNGLRLRLGASFVLDGTHRPK